MIPNRNDEHVETAVMDDCVSPKLQAKPTRRAIVADGKTTGNAAARIETHRYVKLIARNISAGEKSRRPVYGEHGHIAQRKLS